MGTERQGSHSQKGEVEMEVAHRENSTLVRTKDRAITFTPNSIVVGTTGSGFLASKMAEVLSQKYDCLSPFQMRITQKQ
jgi:hypothetical protein